MALLVAGEITNTAVLEERGQPENEKDMLPHFRAECLKRPINKTLLYNRCYLVSASRDGDEL